MTPAKPADLYGLLAEFATPEQLVQAARRAQATGFTRMEAYSPQPVHGIEDALGRPPTHVPLLVLLSGVFGALTGFFMCWYAFVISYPLNIGGRPNNSWPAWIPITFELTVLFAGLAAAIGMLALNGFPRPHHPLFAVPLFDHASQDRFFLCVEACDPRFERMGTESILRHWGALSVQEVPRTSHPV